jgi:hypothetical protein
MLVDDDQGTLKAHFTAQQQQQQQQNVEGDFLAAAAEVEAAAAPADIAGGAVQPAADGEAIQREHAAAAGLHMET